MRMPRLKLDGPAYYHITSRVVDRQYIFDSAEKERVRKVMRRFEAFGGIQVLTYAVLSNHFHALIFVPARAPVCDELFLQRLGHIRDRTVVASYAEQLRRYRAAGQDAAAESLKARFVKRMYDLSEFAKSLKQVITQSYNRRHGRKGTLWEERFKSVLAEGRNAGVLSAMAAYIDLNAVRAGIVADPKEYRFCGYGEAVAGSREARVGLSEALGQSGACWSQVAGEYRKLLYVTGECSGLTAEGQPVKPGFDPAKVEAVLKAKGALPTAELLRCRVRYFSDGLVLGAQTFVEDVLRRYGPRLGLKRLPLARAVAGGPAGLCMGRRLTGAAILAPATG